MTQNGRERRRGKKRRVTRSKKRAMSRRGEGGEAQGAFARWPVPASAAASPARAVLPTLAYLFSPTACGRDRVFEGINILGLRANRGSCGRLRRFIGPGGGAARAPLFFPHRTYRPGRRAPAGGEGAGDFGAFAAFFSSSPRAFTTVYFGESQPDSPPRGPEERTQQERTRSEGPRNIQQEVSRGLRARGDQVRAGPELGWRARRPAAAEGGRAAEN